MGHRHRPHRHDEQANETIGVIRKAIAEVYGDDVAQKVRIQYGGSMKGSNVKGLMGAAGDRRRPHRRRVPEG